MSAMFWLVLVVALAVLSAVLGGSFWATGTVYTVILIAVGLGWPRGRKRELWRLPLVGFGAAALRVGYQDLWPPASGKEVALLSVTTILLLAIIGGSALRDALGRKRRSRPSDANRDPV